MTDVRCPSAVGRQARLELAFGCRDGRTLLDHAYAEPPLRIGRVFDLHDAAYLILVCTGPGVFGGDRLRQKISVGRGARVVLVSQSALQVHPAAAPDIASVHHEYRVEDGGELHCCWDPVVPFAGARLEQRFDVHVGQSGRLYWSDALMSGRVGRGEAWQFASLDHELRLVVGGKLTYLERCRLANDSRPRERWAAGSAHYMSTTIVRHDAATSEQAERLHRNAASMDGVRAAADLIETGVIVGRMLASNGAAFAKARTRFREQALVDVFERPDLIARR
jgi:urease accessory protein UreH